MPAPWDRLWHCATPSDYCDTSSIVPARQKKRLFDGDLVERFRHLDVAVSTRSVRLDADSDVVVDYPLTATSAFI